MPTPMSPTDNKPAERSTFARLLREPFLHFTLIGAAIFAVALWRGDDTEKAGEKQIVLTNSDLRPTRDRVASPRPARSERRTISAPHRCKDPRRSPLSRSRGHGTRPGRHHRKAPHGPEDELPRRGPLHLAGSQRGRPSSMVSTPTNKTSPFRPESISAISIFPSTAIATKPVKPPQARSSSHRGSRRTHPKPRLWESLSCSRTATPRALPNN